MSLADAAKAAGLGSRQHWHAIESGARANLTVDMLERVARALGVKPAALLK